MNASFTDTRLKLLLDIRVIPGITLSVLYHFRHHPMAVLNSRSRFSMEALTKEALNMLAFVIGAFLVLGLLEMVRVAYKA